VCVCVCGFVVLCVPACVCAQRLLAWSLNEVGWRPVGYPHDEFEEVSRISAE
jgi:hypothetical protein